MISVLLVDDHDLVRRGIRRMLDDIADIEVVAEASSGEEALERIEQFHPEVVLMDVNMPGIGGLEATRRILQLNPDMRVVGLSVHVDGTFPKRLLKAGAKGYITKGCSMDEFLQAIRMAKQGQQYIGREVAQNLALDLLAGSHLSLDELTERELQVMRMISLGRTVQDISDALYLSPKTVSTYRSRLLKKLGVETDVELTHLALRNGLIESGSGPEQH